MLNKLKKWLGILDLEAKNTVFNQRLDKQASAIQKRIKELDKLTCEDVDIGMRGSSTIILTGVYRGRGYVKFYDVPPEDFHRFVEQFRHMRKFNLIRNVDAPYPVYGAFDLAKPGKDKW